MQRIAGLFVDGRAELLRLREGDQERTLGTVIGAVLYRGRLNILVDERTGSAAELLAAALQDLGRARVFGRTTAGSTRSRRTSLLPGGVVFHYAGPSEFLRRDGSAIEGFGVEPDIRYHPSRDDLARGFYGDPYRDSLVGVVLSTN
jgi:carboxyl-terminal processing protease